MKVILFNFLVAICIIGSNSAGVENNCKDVCAIRCPDGTMCVLSPCELKARKEQFNERWHIVGDPSVCPKTCKSQLCACIKKMNKNSGCNCPWPKTNNPCKWLKKHITQKGTTPKNPCTTTRSTTPTTTKRSTTPTTTRRCTTPTTTSRPTPSTTTRKVTTGKPCGCH